MKFDVTFLFDTKNSWFYERFKKQKLILHKKYNFKFSHDYKKIKKQEIVIILSYTKILPKSFLQKNKLNVVVHSSKLPLDKGFAPLAYQVLKNKTLIFNTLFKVSEKVDSGPIIKTNKFKINITDLYSDLRFKQYNSIVKLIFDFLKAYPKIKLREQKGKGSYNKRRNPADSLINISKSIKSQLNLLRVCDNENFPAFFIYKNKKFIIKIFKDDLVK
tara:strand:+ start:91 stop:741 length:651 start_codon:yes stop_codon:yes gene_type:complete